MGSEPTASPSAPVPLGGEGGGHRRDYDFHSSPPPPMTLDTEVGSDLYAKLRHSLGGSDDGFAFPFDLSSYRRVSIDPFTTPALSPSQRDDLKHNMDLCRDVIVFFTSCGNRSGYGGHTGGAYDTVPEVVIFDAFFRSRPDRFVPVFYDEAGHRVATQYLMAALDGKISPEFLRFYRKGYSNLPGHPELTLTPGIKFSSGRLGHMWGAVNGIAMANPGKAVLLLGSDGSQMEGNDAEAARLAVAKGLNVKVVVDDNDVTISGHPNQYLKGFDLETTLKGHGMNVTVVDGEDLDALYSACRDAAVEDGPAGVVVRRVMAPGIGGVEGSNHGHDAVPADLAIPYLESRGHVEAARYLKIVTKTADPYEYKCCGSRGAMRAAIGQTVVDILSEMSPEDRKSSVMVIDSDLGGSTNFSKIQASHPEVYVQSGVMERGNFSAAAGFGTCPSKQGVFSTFAVFLEMMCSEISMARLNRSNVYCHLSHSGVDDMSDNTCHFGLNNMFADNGLEDGYDTTLYFPADTLQAAKVVRRTFPLRGDGYANRGLRFVFSTRSKTPTLLKDDGTEVFGDGYEFIPGRDELVRDGTAGYIVTFGDAAYRCLDAVVRLKSEGIDVGLINKPTLNVPDPEMMERVASSPMCLVVECLGLRTGLGSRFGTWLMETDRAGGGGTLPKYGRIATCREGGGGTWEQAYHQGYDSESIRRRVKDMLGV